MSSVQEIKDPKVKEMKWVDLASEVETLYAIGPNDGPSTEKTKSVEKIDGIYMHARRTRVNDTLLHVFRELDSDELFGVWGFYKLDAALATVPETARVRILYTGAKEIKKGRKPMKTCKVMVPAGTPTVQRQVIELSSGDEPF